MDIFLYLKSVVELDEMAVVLCDTEHTIIYMNKAAKLKYDKQGGAELIGKSLLDCHNEKSCEIINDILDKFRRDCSLNKVFTYHSIKNSADNDVYMVALRDEENNLIGYYEKFESRIPEKKG